MGTLTLTNKAKTDLKSVITYTQRKWAEEGQRGIYLKQFDEAFYLLADTPEVTTKCYFIRLGYRKFTNITHVIFYRILDKAQIEVIHILHKRIDVEISMRNP